MDKLDFNLVSAILNTRIAALKRQHLIGHLRTSIFYMGRLAGYNAKWSSLLAMYEAEHASMVNPTCNPTCDGNRACRPTPDQHLGARAASSGADGVCTAVWLAHEIAEPEDE